MKEDDDLQEAAAERQELRQCATFLSQPARKDGRTRWDTMGRVRTGNDKDGRHFEGVLLLLLGTSVTSRSAVIESVSKKCDSSRHDRGPFAISRGQDTCGKTKRTSHKCSSPFENEPLLPRKMDLDLLSTV